MADPAIPLPLYRTSIQTRHTLSAAFSAQFNRRGLESRFYACWTSSLSDAVTFSHRLCVTFGTETSIPGDSIRKASLKARAVQLADRNNAIVAAGHAANDAQTGHTERTRKIAKAKAEAALTEVQRDQRNLRAERKELEKGIKASTHNFFRLCECTIR